MILRVTIRGREVLAVEIARSTEVETEVEECENYTDMTGGSSHNFERDVNVLDPNERYAPWDRFGFGD